MQYTLHPITILFLRYGGRSSQKQRYFGVVNGDNAKYVFLFSSWTLILLCLYKMSIKIFKWRLKKIAVLDCYHCSLQNCLSHFVFCAFLWNILLHKYKYGIHSIVAWVAYKYLCLFQKNKINYKSFLGSEIHGMLCVKVMLHSL